MFGNSSDLQEVGAFDMVLRASGVTGRLRLRVHRHSANNLRQQFEVFTGKGLARRVVSSLYLFTGLALVDSTNPMYIMLPVKFTEALLPGSLKSKGDADAATALDLGEDGDTKVFVNFMSHVRFEERALHSGPVDISWTNNNNDRIKSAASKPLSKALASSQQDSAAARDLAAPAS